MYTYCTAVVRRQANSVDDCTIDDCMIDDGCITEESYNAGLFDSCYGEQLTNWLYITIIIYHYLQLRHYKLDSPKALWL